MTNCVLQVGGRVVEEMGEKVGALTRANDQSNVHSEREKEGDHSSLNAHYPTSY